MKQKKLLHRISFLPLIVLCSCIVLPNASAQQLSIEPVSTPSINTTDTAFRVDISPMYVYEPSRTEQLNADNSFPARTFNINPLGLLQFGPILQGEFKVTNTGYLAPHIRIPYLGLLYHVINSDHSSDEVTVSPAALGAGLGYKNFFPTEKGGWYLGGAVEYSFGSSNGNDGKEWKSEFSNIALMPNGGYRWRWPEKGKSISVGAYAGIYSALRDEWWYTNNPANTFDERSTTALFMLELSFGWEK